MITLVLIAKETIPGKVKTRLHPPLTLEQAADLAAASIADTIHAVASIPAIRRVLLFDGNSLPPGSEQYDVMNQVDGDLDERLGDLFDRVQGRTLLIGMDTPQVTADLLAPVFDDWSSDVDAWFGPAADGGFWALGLAEPDGALLRGVPMSRDDTGSIQLERLTTAGLSVRMLPELVDVDTIDTARQVATIAPDGNFARTLASFNSPTASPKASLDSPAASFGSTTGGVR